MKLVEVLAKELACWPEDASCITQDDGGCMNGGTVEYPPVLHSNAWGGGAFYLDDPDNTDLVMNLTQADDYQTAIVTSEMWQAERDRQNGGEWKRHRGNKLPIDGGLYIEAKLRCGDIQRGYAQDFIWPHAACDVEVNLMKYRVICQPQAEEVEVIKVDPVVAANVEAFNGQWQIGRVDGPLVWRDTVIELDAYIEEFTREREALINRLALEGFALLPAMTAVMGVADVDMGDWRNWQVGDIVSIKDDVDVDDGEYRVLEIEHSEYEGDMPIKTDDGWPDMDCAKIEFVRRP